MVQRIAAQTLLDSASTASFCVASRMALWKARSAARPASVESFSRSMASSASVMVRNCASVRRSAANAAEGGSTISRTSNRSRTNASLGQVCRNQPSTSGSRMFQRWRGLTRVPVRVRLSTMPLAARIRTASR